MKNKSDGQFEALGLLVTIVVGVLLYCLGLGSYGVTDPGEGYYVEAGREMVELSNYVTPHLNYQVYFSKPVLTFWITAFSYLAFGISEWAARLPFAIMAVSLFVITFKITSKLAGVRAGLTASVIAATSPLMMAFVKLSPIDITFAFFLDLTVFALAFTCLFEVNEWWPLVWIGISGAVLTKGPAGLVLTGLGTVAYLIFERAPSSVNLHRLKRLHILPGIAIFLACILPWCLAVTKASDGLFLKVFFLYENYARFAGHTNLAHSGLFTYFGVLFAGFFPWSLLIPTAFAEAFSYRAKSRRESSFLRFLAFWSIAFFAFFSFSKTQLDTYILPIVAPLSVMVACYLESLLLRSARHMRASGWLKLVSLTLIVVFLIAVPIVLVAITYKADLIFPFWARILLALISLVGGGVSSWFVVNRHSARALPVVLATLVMISSVGTVAAFQMADSDGQAQLRRLCLFAKTKHARYSLFRSFKPSMMFYLEQPVDSFFHPSQIVRCDLQNETQFVFVHEKQLSALVLPPGVDWRLVRRDQGWYIFRLIHGKVQSVTSLEAMFRDPETFHRAISGESNWGPLTVPYGAGKK